MARNSLLCADVPLRDYSLTIVKEAVINLLMEPVIFSVSGGLQSLNAF